MRVLVNLSFFVTALALAVLATPEPTQSTMSAAQAADRVRTLISLLEHPDPSVRFDAVAELSTLRPASFAAAVPLARSLDDVDAHIPIWSARVLETLGPGAAEAVPALVRHLQGTNDDLRKACASALGNIGAASAAPALARLFDDPDPSLWEASAYALIRIGSAPASAVPFLLSHITTASWATPLLVRIGRPALDLVAPAWQRTQEQGDSKTLSALEIVLFRIDPERFWALKVAANIVGLSDEAKRGRAISNLGSAGHGRSTGRAVAALLSARAAAASEVDSALRQIGEEALPHIMEEWRAGRNSGAARAALHSFGRAAAGALLEAFRDPALRPDVARLLARLPGIDADNPAGPHGKEIRTALRTQVDWLVPELLNDGTGSQIATPLRAMGDAAAQRLVVELRGGSSKKARFALQSMEGRAASALLQALTDPAVRRDAAILLARLKDVRGERADSPMRSQVLLALSTHAGSLVPDLVRGLGTDPQSHDAAMALALIGSAAIPALIPHLREPSGATVFAALALRHMKTSAAPAIPDLIELLATTPRLSQRLDLASILAVTGESARRPLNQALKDSRSRFPASVALLRMGGEPATGTAALMAMLAHPTSLDEPDNAAYRAAGITEFKYLGAEGTRYLLERTEAGDERAFDLLAGVIAETADDLRRDPWSRGKERDRLRKEFDDLAHDATPALSRMLSVVETRPTALLAFANLRVMAPIEASAHSEDVSVRVDTAKSVAPLGSTALPILSILLTDPSAMVRRHAVSALASIHVRGDPAVLPALVEAVSRADEATCWTVIHSAAEAVQDMTGGARERVALEIVRRLRRSPVCGSNAGSSLNLLARELAPLLGAWLLEPEANSWDSVRLIAEMGVNAAPASGPLGKALAHRDVAVRKKAVEALVGIGRGAAPAVPNLVEALSDPAIRWTAATALAAIGGPALPQLIEALGDEQRRTPAAVALGKLGPGASAALPALKQLRDVGDADFRDAVAAAIGSIMAAARPSQH